MIIWAIIFERFRRHHRHKHPHRIHLWLGINDTAIMLHPHEKEMIMSQLHINQVDNLSLAATDASGNPVNPIPFTSGTSPQWTNSNPAAAALTVSSDGMTAVVAPIATAAGQSTTVTVSAQIDDGLGNSNTFEGSVEIDIVSGSVAQLSIVENITVAPVTLAARKK